MSIRRSVRARARVPSLQHGRRFEVNRADAEPTHLHLSEVRRDQYALACDKGHSFESWFQNSAAYDKQAKRKLIECPVCGSLKVEKASWRRASRAATRARRSRCVRRSRSRDRDAGQQPSRDDLAAGARVRKKLKELRDH